MKRSEKTRTGLQLKRETLRQLTPRELPQVQGGGNPLDTVEGGKTQNPKSTPP